MKKIALTFLSLFILILSCRAFAQSGSLANFTDRRPRQTFTDVTPDEWYFDVVSDAAALEIIEGDEKGRFLPKNNLTIGEALALASKTNAIYYGNEAPQPSLGGHWADDISEYAYEHNIGDFFQRDFDALITRGEMMMLFYNALAEGSPECGDLSPINDFSLSKDQSDNTYAKILFEAGVISGDENGSFNLESPIRRSEAASIILRIARPEKRVKVKIQPDSNGLYILPDKIMEAYYADENAKQKYINMLNLYAERTPMTVNMKVMLVPTSISFSDDLYRDSCDSQKDTIDSIYGAMNDRILPLDVYSQLESHKDEYIFFKTDHHWTHLGAYYGYKSMCGEYTYPLSDFTQNSMGAFTGWLYDHAGRPNLTNGYDRLDWYSVGYNYPVNIYTKTSSYTTRMFNTNGWGMPSYLLFMGGDAPFATVTSGMKNGKTLLVMKDSYGNALLPYLINHYETTIIVDPRTCHKSMNEIFSQYNVDDFLIVDYVMATNFSDFIDMQIALWK